jgi:hypothetical protein
MSIASLLRETPLDALLALSPVQLGMIVTIAVLCLMGISAVIFYATRGPVYISPIPSQPFWRRRVTYRLGACSLVAVLLLILL